MKLTFLIASAALVLAALASSQLPRSVAVARPVDAGASKSPVNRFYCDRQAIPASQMKRKLELGQAVRTSIRFTRELPDGFEFVLGNGSASFQQAAEWASMERLCCPFFDIRLELSHDQGPVRLRLTGDPGVKQFIQSEFGKEWFANAEPNGSSQ